MSAWTVRVQSARLAVRVQSNRGSPPDQQPMIASCLIHQFVRKERSPWSQIDGSVPLTQHVILRQGCTAGESIQGYLENRSQTPMAQDRSTKIISMIKWIRTSRFSITNALSKEWLQYSTPVRGGSAHSERPIYYPKSQQLPHSLQGN